MKRGINALIVLIILSTTVLAFGGSGSSCDSKVDGLAQRCQVGIGSTTAGAYQLPSSMQ